ncbi:hypothetical protein [Clostridium sp. BJN0001]|uniref:hypothetical protein n=1 Tax=Clostridium sp. BJN0001 TaxID=2930219 RepID=UPI001FD45A9E|nr:hypothetical protein [Clostridium sp. BJN0001]
MFNSKIAILLIIIVLLIIPTPVSADVGNIGKNSSIEIAPITLKSSMTIKAKSPEIVYNPYNISIKSNISIEKAYDMLSGTTYQTKECAKAFVEAENLDNPINSIFLIALTRLESGHGKNILATNQNNISSWRISRGGYRTFESKASCIKDTASLLSKQYISPSGLYHKGTSIWNIGTSYSESNIWAENVNIISYELLNKYKNN